MSHDADSLRYAINHIFLPLQLPQESDQTGDKDNFISKIVFDASEAFRRHLRPEEVLFWAPMSRMVKAFWDVQKTDIINAKDVKGALDRLLIGQSFALFVRAQNAGVIFRRLSRERVTFEAFEVSPPSSDVINTTGRLLCSYPGPAIQFTSTVFDSNDFKDELANFLTQMNNESFEQDDDEGRRRRPRWGSSDVEGSETPDPKYITSLLTGILRGLHGEAADVERIMKHIRDDAIVKQRKALWRRSGAWLVLRVAMQTTLMRHDRSHVWYKSFMAYLHAFVLNLALEHSLDSDLLQIMCAKTGRRLAKLLRNYTVKDFVRHYVLGTCDRTRNALQERWTRIQALDAIPPSVARMPWAPMSLHVDFDTHMRLNNSSAYIRAALGPDPRQLPTPAFTPCEYPRLRDVDHFGQVTAAKLEAGYSKDPFTTLVDFEFLVARGLNRWLIPCLGFSVPQGSSRHLWDLMSAYHTRASEHYAGYPEDQSLMVLTVLELWVAIDKLACAAIPLMKNYSPEVPLDTFKPFYRHLLLRKTIDLERLRKVDEYLRRRHHAARDGSVFEDRMTPRSFPVRYYDTIVAMQHLRAQIEADARADRNRKIQELREKMDEYHRLLALINVTQHRHFEDEPRWGSSRKKRQKRNVGHPDCRRCQLDEDFNRLRATKHEWPLPSKELDVKRVVFELRVPTEFALWRAATALVLWDMGTPATMQAGFKAQDQVKLLEKTSPLASHYVFDKRAITLASSSWLRYEITTLPATESDICVPNAMSWRGYNTDRHVWIVSPGGGNMFQNVDTRVYGTLVLDSSSPPSKYVKAGLSYAVTSTDHTSNHVLASQSDCPPEMSLHEYIAYGTMRAGGRIQWMNLLRELRATGSGLSWGDVEVGVLVLMVIAQVGLFEGFQSEQGPLTGELEWHSELKEYPFGKQLVHETSSLLAHVEGNWKEVITVHSIVLIVSRLLASSPHVEVTSACKELLLKARGVTWGWLQQLEVKMQEATQGSAKLFQDRVCEMAAVCRSTFDVDDIFEIGYGNGYLPDILFTSEDVSIYVCCGILLYDNMPIDLETGTSPSLRRLIRRDQRMSYIVEPHLRYMITAPDYENVGNLGLDLAIGHIWKAYRREYRRWSVLDRPNRRWARCVAAPVGATPTSVNLDFLNGKLLVNGKPLGRLPPQITNHALYTRIFGNVYFGMREENLVIRASKDGKVLELIPHQYFYGDLPVRLVEDFAHWLDLSSGEIEIRPLSGIWESDGSNWVIHFRQAPRVCMNATRTMIDITSRTFQMVAATLEPFEKGKYIIVTCARNQDPSTLAVELPRYRLSFFRNSNHALESRNFPGNVIDHEDQSIGVLIGLRNCLVLRPDDPTLAGARRKILIPYGKIDVPSYRGNHVEVCIDTKNAPLIRFANYVVDKDQGCITGITSLESRLYLVYLLALTSHCLPDPLTHQTGTEEALSEFNSAACMSFRELGEEETALLFQISELSPTRFGAPQNSPKAQSITWNSLPSLSQHDGFAVRAGQILECAQLQRVFHENATMSDRSDLSSRNHMLDVRAAARSRVCYPAGIATRIAHTVNDRSYASRDMKLLAEKGVCSVAASVFAGGTSLYLPTHPALPGLFEEWKILRASSSNFELSFNRGWFDICMPDAWLSIYKQCISRHSSQEKKQHQLLFSLAAMVFSNPDHRRFVPAIVLSSWDTDNLPNFSPPESSRSTFDVQKGTRPTRSAIEKIIQDATVSLHISPSWSIPRYADETQFNHTHRRQCHYTNLTTNYRSQLCVYFMGKWAGWIDSQSAIDFPSTVDRSYFMFESLVERVTDYFQSCCENSLLLEHAHRVEDIFDLHLNNVMEEDVESYDFQPYTGSTLSLHISITLGALLQRDCPQIPRRGTELWSDEGSRRTEAPAESHKLAALLCSMDGAVPPLQKLYVQNLRESHRNLTALPAPPSAPPNQSNIEHQIKLCKDRHRGIQHCILTALAPIAGWEKVLDSVGIWPRLTPRVLLRQLAYPYNRNLSPSWKEALILLAREMLEYQRAIRLLSYAQQSRKEDLFRELDTRSFDMESALRYPDWVLIQIEGDFLARSLQLDVAREMIDPSSGMNTVLQLNMGEGKSSVIVPLVATALANGEKIVRVVVLKPLAGQMFQLLVERLAGLANRRVFYMPFSRQVRVGQEQVAQIQKLYLTCMEEGGIWVVQPEHILSFKLMGIDKSLVSRDNAVAQSLIQLQHWLNLRSRDILDESDEILHIRYQLVYTVGQQRPLELHPDRWNIVEELFTLVSRHVEEVKSRNHHGVDLQSTIHGGFAPVRIVDLKAGKELVETIVEDILGDSLPTFSVRFFTQEVKNQARLFITVPKIPNELVVKLKNSVAGGDYKRLLLLRGLIAHGILLYTLREKQYRVDYGLDLSRSLLAVPYRAKDVPSPRAEFGHPDVGLALTCLSYYYQGLTSPQLKLCFDILNKLDNPPLEYEAWVNGDAEIPLHLRSLNGINTEDEDQHHKFIIPLFSKRKTVVDFYLSHVVFPKAAKEFQHKLSTSAWDLAETKPGHVTTGFSGTNDNRFLLPTSISQQDPLEQGGTNAKVLGYLLQHENDHYRCTTLPGGGRLPVRQFLEYLTRETVDNPVQVLLDVGAQMLDLKNDELAKYWLTLRIDKAAAIFFNEKDEMTVVTQDGVEEPLTTSPFKGLLGQCLVYLDDAHTRGTDLKLPPKSRAAVTLGPKVTKDRLIQGCMRMRKLGFGQSLIFFAPDEIDRSIRKSRPPEPSDFSASYLDRPIHTEDILRWAILETCSDIKHHLPHWAQQGSDYLQRRRAWDVFVRDRARNDGAQVMTQSIDGLGRSWKREEARSLEMMYGVNTGRGNLGVQEAVFTIPELRDRLAMLGITQVSSSYVDEEQEREVNHEIEQETEIERPPKVRAAQHQVSPGLPEFVKTGLLPWGEHDDHYRKGFIPMFSSLDGTIATVPSDGRAIWSPGLWVTEDFAKTICARDAIERGNAEYLRPVNWLLTSRLRNDIIIAISPYETDQLLPEIRASQHVNLHVYTPRVTKEMQPLDGLLFYSVPPILQPRIPSPHIISQLNIFAGQLYLTSFEDYRRLSDFLGLQIDHSNPYRAQSDGFIMPGGLRRELGVHECRFAESPVPFLQELIGLRRKGAGYLPTHMGKIVHGRLLKESDFAS
ncbi:hypothetical protein VNI00_012915 [Paramarasmius palmivorus]|uniref:ubiquitinyl hydrolase 1 n=1 Tax=Paramarasmius palmivorus TaxID=297713 RepID=A0AAW0C1K7_9AGAR